MGKKSKKSNEGDQNADKLIDDADEEGSPGKRSKSTKQASKRKEAVDPEEQSSPRLACLFIVLVIVKFEIANIIVVLRNSVWSTFNGQLLLSSWVCLLFALDCYWFLGASVRQTLLGTTLLRALVQRICLLE